MSDASTISYRITPNTYAKNADKAKALTPIQLTRIVSEGIAHARTEVVKRTPVGWSGSLRAGYQTETRRRNTKSPRAALLNPVFHHDIVEDGRKPGKRPPVEALVPWVGSKLGIPPSERHSVAFLVARKIGQKGFEGAHMVEEGWDEARDRLKPLLKEAGLRLVKEMSK